MRCDLHKRRRPLEKIQKADRRHCLAPPAATQTEGIFRVSGSNKRINELQAIFDQPPRYGKDFDWTGYSVHDAASVLRRYLNSLPVRPSCLGRVIGPSVKLTCW